MKASIVSLMNYFFKNGLLIKNTNNSSKKVIKSTFIFKFMRILQILILILLPFIGKCQYSFKDFLRVKIFLYYLEKDSTLLRKVKYTDIEYYKGINLGFNDYNKYKYLLTYYKNYFDNIELKKLVYNYVSLGLCDINIPSVIKFNQNIYDNSLFTNARHKFLKNVNSKLYEQMCIINQRDQWG